MLLFGWVLSTSARVSVFVIFLLLIKFVLRHKLTAMWHYRLWFILIIGLLLPWTPQSPLGVFNIVNPNSHQFFSSTNRLPTGLGALNQWVSGNASANKLAQDVGPVTNTNGTTSILSQRKENSVPLYTLLSPQSGFSLLYVIWLIGFGVMCISTAGANFLFARRIKERSISVKEENIILTFNLVKEKLNITSQIPIIQTSEIKSPSLFGIFYPRLLFPTGLLKTFSTEQLNYVFVHELSHFRQKDILVNWITRGLLCLHWFNPLLWYAFNKMRIDQEIACDAASLSCIGESESKNYAETLIMLMENQSKAIPVASLANLFGSRSQIRRRITMIKLFGKSKARWSIGGLVVVILLAGAVLTNANTTNTYNNYLSFKSDIHNLIFGLPNYHTPVNQGDISEIRISMNGTDKQINTKDWSSIIQEFNNSKITRVRNLDVSHNMVVSLVLNDRSGRTLTFAVNGNEIRVSRHIGETKVDYIAENPKIINIVTGLYDNADMSALEVHEKVTIPTNSQPENEAPVFNDERTEEYKTSLRKAQEMLPKVHILYENIEIPYMRGNSLFTGEAEVDPILGAGSFGWTYRDILATKGSKIKSKGKLQVTADEVKGLEKPKIQVRQYLKAFAGTDYPIEGNVMLAPENPGVYIFEINVNWSKHEQNEINYLFKVTVE